MVGTICVWVVRSVVVVSVYIMLKTFLWSHWVSYSTYFMNVILPCHWRYIFCKNHLQQPPFCLWNSYLQPFLKFNYMAFLRHFFHRKGATSTLFLHNEIYCIVRSKLVYLVSLLTYQLIQLAVCTFLNSITRNNLSAIMTSNCKLHQTPSPIKHSTFMHLGFEVVMLDGWSEVVEDYILAENIIRIGTIHAAVPYTDIQHTHKRWKKIPIHIVEFFVVSEMLSSALE